MFYDISVYLSSLSGLIKLNIFKMLDVTNNIFFMKFCQHGAYGNS